jgi:hypothetical protein
MAVTYGAVGSGGSSSNSSWIPGLPIRSAGDLLVAVTGIRSITKSAVLTPGTTVWTPRYDFIHTDAAGLSRIQVWTATATNTVQDACSFSLSASETGCTNLGFIFSVSGANVTTPITLAQRAGNDSGAGTASNIGPTATLVAATTGSLMVSVGHKADDSNNATPIATPAGWTIIRSVTSASGNDALIGGFYRAATATTSYGGETWTVNATTTAVPWASIIFEINEAVAGTTYPSTPSGSITPSAAVTIRTNKPTGGSPGLAGAVTRSTGKTVAGTVTPAGALRRSVSKIVAGTLALAGTLSGLKIIVYLQSVGGALTPAGTVARRTTKIVGGALTPAGTIAKRIAKSFAGTITAAGALVTAWFNFDQADVTLTDAAVTVLSLADSAVTVLSLSDAAVTVLTLADSAVTALTLADSAVSTLVLTDGTT